MEDDKKIIEEEEKNNIKDKDEIIDIENNNNNSNIDLIKNNNDRSEESEEEKEEEKEEKEIDPSKEIELLYESLLEMFSKKQFKKIIKTMVLKADKEEKYNLLEWKLLYLRSVSFHKILEKKNRNYYKLSTIPHFSEYIQKVNNDIDHWISFTQELTKKNEIIHVNSLLEFIIMFMLQKCIALAKNYIHLGHIKDAVGILSLGVRFIIKSFNYMKSPDSYALAGEIFLNLSSIMIAEDNYETAKSFISMCIKLSYISLEVKLFKNGINYSIFNITEYKNELPQISKLFFNLSIAFYQLGICYENQGNAYDSLYALKTSKFFSRLMENHSIVFINMIKDIETRLLMRNRIILFFEKNTKISDLEEKVVKIKKVYNKLYHREERRKQKFKRIQEYIENLKLIDVDNEEPDLFNKIGHKPMNEKVLHSTKQIQLLNSLMSEDFKELIHKMKKIEINKLDKDTINKIQKKIISLKNNERVKLEEKKKNEMERKKNSKEKKNQFQEISEEKDEKTINIKRNNQSNTIKSLSKYSLTTANTKKSRINSAFKSINRKHLLTINDHYNSNKTLKTYIERPVTTESIYSTPSRYFSINENNTKSISKKFFSRDKIMNQKMAFSAKRYNNTTDIVSKPNKMKIVKNVYKFSQKYIPRYNYNNYYFNKKFKKKYNFLETQYDKELAFQKQLLKTKCIKDETNKPESFNIRDIHEKVEEYYYTTFENELMNAKEKQIIFDKTEQANVNKSKPKKIFSIDNKLHTPIHLRNEKDYLNSYQITEVNGNCINEITNKILKISSQEKNIAKKKRKILYE